MNSKRKLQLTGIAAAVVAALVVSLAPTINSRLARNDVIREAPTAVVALSSGVLPNGELDRIGTDRLNEAARLAIRFPDAKLVTTRVRNSHNLSSDAAQQRLLVERRFPLSRWTILSPVVTSTRDEAQSLAHAQTADSTLIVVVTSGPHTARACATFERVGFRVICRIAAPTRQAWWRPTFDLFYERAATVMYRFRGWI